MRSQPPFGYVRRAPVVLPTVGLETEEQIVVNGQGHAYPYTSQIGNVLKTGAGACSVEWRFEPYAAFGGTAVAGTDYVNDSGTLEWESDDEDPQPIDITLLATVSPFVGVKLILENPVGATLLLDERELILTPSGD